ncbi:MAG TPA: CDGSH iron-sulfur domain-containing protein [Candidatus Dorea intestinavium]|nr:CDGSH iron-sulfur domain-containing protein [Candidatus Dorea intestinavium]
MKITITKNGPYLVTGGVPLKEMIITKVGKHYEFKEGRTFPLEDEYALCRCGQSKTAPFCDGSHETFDFDGTETANMAPYLKRIEDVVEGKDIILVDDGRCAFARFCHREGGDVWSLTHDDQKSNNKDEAIIAAHECPAGRLTMFDKDGHNLDTPNKPEIIIMQDPEQECSAGLFVKGPITLESADGKTYEIRNRVTLCRCGHSSNMPFCDATHVSCEFNDHIDG